MNPQRPSGVPLVDVRNLSMHFPIVKGVFKRTVGSVKAVDGVSFTINTRETVGLVGESGCGKTTTGRLIMRALDPTAGRVLFHEDAGAGRPPVDVTALRGRELHGYWHQAQMIFQDPYSSLNPRMTVRQIVSEPLRCLTDMSQQLRDERVQQLLEVVGLDPSYGNRYPHAFSGGQRQRIGIARALAVNPRLIVADEAVSALDVSVQAQIVNLLEALQAGFGLSYLFVSHDLGVVRHISDRVAVMYVGKLVEVGQTDELFAHPMHPYTEALLSAVPQPDPDYRLQRIALPGDVADPANRPSGCCFHPRCRYATPRCGVEEPPLGDLGGPEGRPHLVACHHAGQLQLRGVTTGVERAEAKPGGAEPANGDASGNPEC